LELNTNFALFTGTSKFRTFNFEMINW